MSKIDIIRAWKDEDYRESLTDAELPAHPAGAVELDDEELTEVRGAVLPLSLTGTTHRGTICKE